MVIYDSSYDSSPYLSEFSKSSHHCRSKKPPKAVNLCKTENEISHVCDIINGVFRLIWLLPFMIHNRILANNRGHYTIDGLKNKEIPKVANLGKKKNETSHVCKLIIVCHIIPSTSSLSSSLIPWDP